MSKKKNKRFKKNKPQKVFLNEKSESSNTLVSSDTTISDESIANDQTAQASTVKIDDPYTHNQYDHVKKDTKKILIIIGIISVIFLGIYFIGLKTEILNSFGDWIYKIANIQTQ
jgi:hypothetical protein